MVLEGLKKALNTVNGLKQCLAEIKKKKKPLKKQIKKTNQKPIRVRHCWLPDPNCIPDNKSHHGNRGHSSG